MKILDVQHVAVVGFNHEALNACVFLASLGKSVQLYAEEADVALILQQHQFDKQLSALWQMYVAKGAICQNAMQATLPQFALLWVFVDGLEGRFWDDFVQRHYIQERIILSGTLPIGDMQALAVRCKSPWVYYVPFIFMKDGANFGSFFRANLLIIGEKTKNSTDTCDVLLFLKKQAVRHKIADIHTIEFARSAIMGMLAARISFINEMARLADAQNINIHQIQEIVGQDERIGAQYLSAGWGFGGHSLPNELLYLQQSFAQSGMSPSLVHATTTINDDQKELPFRKFWQYFEGCIEGKTVVIWGAGYRAGAFLTTHSAIHPLLRLLWSYDIKTLIYAHHTRAELLNMYPNQPLLVPIDDPYDCLGVAHGLFVVNWSHFLLPDIDKLNRAGVAIFDAKNIFGTQSVLQLTVPYFGMGITRP